MELQCKTSCVSNPFFYVSGTRSAPISVLSGSWGATVNYDPGLRAHQPPGLPEQAYLVNFNVH